MKFFSLKRPCFPALYFERIKSKDDSLALRLVFPKHFPTKRNSCLDTQLVPRLGQEKMQEGTSWELRPTRGGVRGHRSGREGSQNIKMNNHCSGLKSDQWQMIQESMILQMRKTHKINRSPLQVARIHLHYPEQYRERIPLWSWFSKTNCIWRQSDSWWEKVVNHGEITANKCKRAQELETQHCVAANEIMERGRILTGC